MKIIILGEGVIGATTAYFLLKEGHEVTLIDRHEEPAMESSFANGSQLSYSHMEPWANWQTLFKALRWIGKRDAPLYLMPRLDPEMYAWIFKFILNCPIRKVHENTLNLLKLSFYSKKIMHQLMNEHKLEFDYNNKGILHLYRNQKYMDNLKEHFDFQAKNFKEFSYHTLTTEECINLEPSLANHDHDFYGGIHCHLDEVGDVHKFTLEMQKLIIKMGGKFLHNTQVKALTFNGQRITGVSTTNGFITADAYIAALGVYNRPILKKVGISLPIYPVKGYSITFPILNDHNAPRMSIIDQDKKIVFTRLGENTMRIAGTAQFSGYDSSIEDDRLKPILNAYKHLFPEGGDFDKAVPFACLRPLTPSHTPILGRTKYDNLFVNAGHGSLGWTMAAGSAKIVSDLISGKLPEISLSGLSVDK